MGSRATERQLLGYENKLLHPTAEPIPLPLDFLRSITSNFSDEQELGRGGYGVVYKGILPSGSAIAVKRFHEIIREGDDPSFENEASFLSDIKHQNVIQLLGYCVESKGVMMKQPNGKFIVAEAQTRMLCFEYMCNGGLDKHLSDESSSGLEWNTRYKIIKGICSGLKYLHGRNIIHLDLKPQNILLDTTMVPKIADFGLSRFLSEQKSKTYTSNCRGTTGYMAPEYIDKGVISVKADIFSLGVIIIEILKGCKGDYPDYGKNIEIDSQHFTEKVVSNWRNIFKTSSKYTPLELHTQLVKQCIDIALECVHPEKEKRPNISNIIEILNAAEESCYSQNGEDLPIDHQERRPSSSTAEGQERGPRPDVIKHCIGSKEGYTDLIMELRRKLPSPLDRIVMDDILGENPGAYPVLRRQSARASRWLWVELEAVVGQQTFTTALAVRDDNVYCKGFRNQQGVWYELSGERSSCPMLPSSGEWGNVVEQLPGWGVSYSSLLQVHNRGEIEYILSPGLGRAFAETAVRRLARYPVVDGRDDYSTRISLAGLIVMVCESARFNVVLDTFVGGWDSGTGLTRRLAAYMWEWKDMSHGLLQWRMDRYWPRAHRTTRQLVRSAGHALAHIHLVLNYNENPKNAQGSYNLHGENSRSNHPEQDKGGPDSEPSRGPSGSRQHSTNNKKSVLSKQAGGSTKHDNAPDDRPSQPGEDDRQRQSPEETLPGDDNAPDPGHPGDGEDDNAHQGPNQPGEEEDDSSQQGLDKISERYGRPRVEIFAVRANFHVTDMTISVFDGIRGQIIYMPKDQGKQQPEAMEEDEEMNDLQQPEPMEEDEQMKDLVLTGPYRGISGYGNFSIQVDMPSSATGGGKEEDSPSSSDIDGPITWEWDRYNPEYAAQVDAPEPVTHAISLDSWRKINVTYLVMSNSLEATVKVNLPETPQDYLPHEQGQAEADDDRGSKYTARGTMTAHIGGFEKHPIVLFTSAVEVPIPSESLTLPLARPTVQVPQGKRLHIDMAVLHITEYSSNREVKKPADSDSLSFQFGHVSPTPQFNNDTEEVEVNVTWRPQQNKEKIQLKPHQVCIIGDKEEFSAFIGNLRRVLASHPDHEDALEDYRGKKLASTGEHPVLTRPRAKQPKRWIHIELQVVGGRETWSTTLAVRDDKCYGVGFKSQSGVWYDLGIRRGDRALLPEYNSVLLDWGVSYKDILHVSSWDEVAEELDSAKPGKDFAEKAVRTLSRYPYVQEGDNTRLAVAGLFIMVCESAKFNPLLKHFVDGWDNGTGFPHQLMNYIRNWGHVSRALLCWKDLGYDHDTWRNYLGQQPVGIISDPENALDVVHLVFNNREALSNQQDRVPMAEDGGDAGDRDHHQQQQPASAASGGAGVEARSRESVKLFVVQVPKQMSEAEVAALFRGVALVDGVTVIRDRATRVSRGCCFVICPSREEADKAVTAYHNKRTLPGASSPLQVKYADGELERLEHKLFVGMLPKNVTDAEMTELFSKYGNIKDLQILRGSQQTSKAGCAFLKYETKEQAVAAIEALNGTHKIEGSSIPLVVKWADTEKERQARKAQKAQFQSSNMLNANAMQQNSVFGALQMGYVPQYNGFGYQPQGTYGLMQYPPLSPVQNQAAFQNMVQPVNQGSSIHGANSELSPNSVPRSFNSAQLGSPYSPLPGLQYPGVYPGGPINHRPFSNSHSSTKVQNSNANSPSSSPSSNPGPQIEGPPGANLFIYHIPQEFGDHDLANAFHSFGRVLSAKVFVDKATGVSKCFGFVSYDSPASAQAAISVMNGYQLGGKKLKVQLKRDNSKHSKPF